MEARTPTRCSKTGALRFLRSSWQLRLNDLMRMLLSRICLTVGPWRHSRSWRLSRFFVSQSSTSQCSKRFRPMDLFDFCDESPTSAPLPHSRSTPVAVASRIQFTFRKQSAPAMVAQPSRKSNLPTTTFGPAFARKRVLRAEKRWVPEALSIYPYPRAGPGPLATG